jgi:predicted NAD/FAD-dependent oxidoreductase
MGLPIAWIADSQCKGISSAPAVTIHARADFSNTHIDDDEHEISERLIEAGGEWLGSSVVEHALVRWRYARPKRTQREFCRVLIDSPPLVIAGDAFGGPRVEGAAISGWAAADVIEQILRNDTD